MKDDIKKRNHIIRTIEREFTELSKEYDYPIVDRTSLNVYWKGEARKLARTLSLRALSKLIKYDHAIVAHKYLVKGICDSKIRFKQVSDVNMELRC